MLRSLYSGVSGMRNFQTKMDVIANNISNVNTTAFKAGRVRFQDMLSQSVASAQGISGGLGGVNPQQVGLGVKVGAIDTIMTSGALQPTNRDLDFAIEGEGFFVLHDGTATSYTRDGAFYLDHDGNLVNADGLKVMGYKPDWNTSKALAPLQIKDPLNVKDIQSYTIDGTGKITVVYEDGSNGTIGQVALAKFSNTGGLSKVGSNNYAETANSGTSDEGIAGGPGFGVLRQGFVEMSNVDLANEFTEMIITSRAYQANSRTITTSDEMLQELINLKR